MATTQYIGARYVPLFAEPLDWNSDTVYEALTIVYYAGNSYTSRQAVPKGIDITNENFWALTGNYNAQVEQYRQETKNAVAQVDSRLSENEKNVATQLSAQNTQVSNQLSAQNTQVSNQLSANEAKMDTLQSNVNKQVDALSTDIEELGKRNYWISDYKTDDITWSEAFSKLQAVFKGGIINLNINTSEILTLTKPNAHIVGGTVGGLIINVSAESESKVCIDGVTIENTITNGKGIELQQGSNVSIVNCTILAVYGIYVKGQSSGYQFIRQTIISNNTIVGSYGIWFEGESTYYTADTIVNGNIIRSEIYNCYMKNFDGCTFTNNICFMNNSNILEKKSNIYFDLGSFSVIANNELFEAGEHAIYSNQNQNITVQGNNCIWSGQATRKSAICILTERVEADYLNINNNTIDHPSYYGIETTYKYGKINDNVIQFANSNDHFHGTDDAGDYAIYAPMSVNALCFGNITYGGVNAAIKTNAKKLNIASSGSVDSNLSMTSIRKNIYSAAQITQDPNYFVTWFIQANIVATREQFIAGIDKDADGVQGAIYCFGTSFTIGSKVVVSSGNMAYYQIFNGEIVFSPQIALGGL